MKPTLLVGDYLFVSKFSLGYSHFSLPLSLPLFSGRIFFTPPKRGDVVVFRKPHETSIDYIKRLVGLPGDRIQVKDGILNINGVPVKRKFVRDYVSHRNGESIQLKEYIETLPNGRQHYILERSDHEIADNTRVYVVPPHHYFAMGDNRDNSMDSRYLDLVGYIPEENLIGRAVFLFFSVDGSAWKIWDWPWTVRFNRLFKPIH